MSISHVNSAHNRSIALGVTGVVIIFHAIGIIVLSIFISAKYEPTSSIKLLESFFVTEVYGQSGGATSFAQATPGHTTSDEVTPHEPSSHAEAHTLTQTIEERTPDEADVTSAKQDAKHESTDIVKTVRPSPHERPNAAKNPDMNRPITKPAPTVLNIGQGDQSRPSNQPGASDITQPITNAAYLNNPHPAYPRQSRRAGEQGQVILSVQIGVDGLATQVSILKSSGFIRLDDVALQTVQKWRFVPGKKAGIPQTMWVSIPINFVLE